MARPNNGPQLKPNKFGIYEIRWNEGVRSKRRSTWTANLSEAQKVFAGFLIEKSRAESEKERPTIGHIIQHYQDHYVEENVVDKARQNAALERMKTAFGDLFCDELTADAQSNYIRKRRASRGLPPNVKSGRDKPVSNGTIRRELSALVSAIEFAIEDKILTRKMAPTINMPPKSAPRDLYLEPEQAQKLLAAAQGDSERLTRAYRFIFIALETAKRRRAIERLKWFDVDLKNRLIHFRRPDGSPETNKRLGTVPISDALLPVLERAYREKTSEYVLDEPQRREDGSITEGAIRKTFDTAAKNAGMPWVTRHVLRHTWGTWAARRGVSMWDIAGVMGCSVQTAEDNYLHHCPEHLRGAVNQASGLRETGALKPNGELKLINNDQQEAGKS